jgi:ElaB/YqjD/DUF883 family membrane-anchored ribosome-binding protein
MEMNIDAGAAILSMAIRSQPSQLTEGLFNCSPVSDVASRPTRADALEPAKIESEHQGNHCPAKALSRKVRKPGGVAMAAKQKNDSPQWSDEKDHSMTAVEDSLSEYPISEGSDESANQASVDLANQADDSDSAGIRYAVKQPGQSVRRRLLAAWDQGYAASSDAIEDVEDEMSTRPWSTFLAGALLGVIAGYVIASRRY